MREVNGHGATTAYTLDAAGNVTRELVTGDGAKDVTYAYIGTQLTSVTAGGATQKHWYDPNGNLDCVTLAAGTRANCVPGSGGSYSPQVVADYGYDYLDRMTQYRSFVTNGSTSTKDDASDYEYDALDRVATQTESHGAAGSPRTTLLSYLGLGTAVSRETQHNGDDGSDPLATTKTYSHDAYGHRIGLTNAPTGGTAASYTYGYDVHGSVSLGSRTPARLEFQPPRRKSTEPIPRRQHRGGEVHHLNNRRRPYLEHAVVAGSEATSRMRREFSCDGRSISIAVEAHLRIVDACTRAAGMRPTACRRQAAGGVECQRKPCDTGVEPAQREEVLVLVVVVQSLVELLC